MSPYLDINWLDDPSSHWQSSLEQLLNYYRVHGHLTEHDRLEHKETRPLVNRPSASEQEAYLIERDEEDSETWDFYFEDSFPQLLRASTITLLCARLAEWTGFFCDYMMKRSAATATFRDIRKKNWLLDPHLRYLRVIQGCAIDPGHRHVTMLRQYFVLRNAIVHERSDAAALKPLEDRDEIALTEIKIHIHNSAVVACATVATDFVNYLMSTGAERLKTNAQRD